MTKTRRFEMPFAIDSPRLVNPEIGLDRLTLCPQHSYTMDVTLLDAPDNRLLRSGVRLAHRVVEGLGDWYLDAPGWRPWLPSDEREPMGAAGDLPERFSTLVKPFLRTALLGPVAAIACKRFEYLLKAEDNETLGVLSDDVVTVRRGGLTTTRYREVIVVPTGEMTGAQMSFLVSTLTEAGGVEVEQFPRMEQRLGAPASGLSDYPEPRAPGASAPLGDYVAWLLAKRLRELMLADLAARTGAASDASGIRLELGALRGELRGLDGIVDADWRARQLARLDATLDDGVRAPKLSSLGEDYFRLMDSLVMAVRAPSVSADVESDPADRLLPRFDKAVGSLVMSCRVLQEVSPDAAWEAALNAANRACQAHAVAAPLLGKRAARAGRRLRDIEAALRATRPAIPEPDHAEISMLTSWEAYERGRAYQRDVERAQRARGEFIESWPKLSRKLRETQEIPGGSRKAKRRA